MHAAPFSWRRIGEWYRPGTPKGVVGIQLALNSSMLTLLLVLHQTPWLALAGLTLCLAATLWLHAARRRALIVLYGLAGWGAEAWLVGIGKIWRFDQAASGFWDGGLFGVPFYMVVAWSLSGALMIALLDWREKPGG